MKGFYDKELVNIANDIGKKFGARVEDTKLNPIDTSRDWRVNTDKRVEVVDGKRYP